MSLKLLLLLLLDIFYYDYFSPKNKKEKQTNAQHLRGLKMHKRVRDNSMVTIKIIKHYNKYTVTHYQQTTITTTTYN